MSTTCSACCASWNREEPRSAPIADGREAEARFGVIYYGSTTVAMDEALAALECGGLHLDALRVRAFPFSEDVLDFITAHDQVFVVEQNRDAQLQKLLVNECAVDPARLSRSCITTARRSRRGLSQAPLPNATSRHQLPRRPRNDLHHQAQAASSQPCRRTSSAITRRDYEGSFRPFAPAAATIRSARRSFTPVSNSTCQPHRVAKLSGIGCSSKTPDLFSRQVPRIQHRAWAHALGADRSQSGQPRSDLSGRFGRRRFRVHRPWTICPLHAPRRQHGLYRREQRRLRADQRPVLGHFR